MLLCALAPTTALAQQTAAERFGLARDAYFGRQYEQVITLLEPVVGTDDPDADQIIVRESRKYLGAAYVLTHRSDAARTQFRLLLVAQGEEFHLYRLDAARFAASVHEVFREVQNDMIAARDRERALAEQAESEADAQRRAAIEALRELAETPEVTVPHDPTNAWIPFGGGQFQNGNDGLGWFFLLSEAVLALASVTMMVTWVQLDIAADCESGLACRPDPAINGVLTAASVLGAAFWVTVGAGIVEANVNFVPSHQQQERREIPQELRDALQISIGPASVSATLRF